MAATAAALSCGASSCDDGSKPPGGGPGREGHMIKEFALILSGLVLLGGCGPGEQDDAAPGALAQGLRGPRPTGRDLFVDETFGGNGRTCQTCHSTQTGTVSPEEVRQRLRHRRDP